MPVTDIPLRVEQGVDFTVQMDGPPTRARLLLKEAGLPWGEHLVVWINNQRAGIILPAVPDIGDGGYSDSDQTPYAGWRDGTFFVPSGILTTGSNTLQFSSEADAPTASSTSTLVASAPAPLAVKKVLLQLDYPASSPTAAAVAASRPGAVTPSSSGAAPVTSVDDPSASAPATSATLPGVPDSIPDTSSTLVSTPVPNTQNSALLSLPEAASSPSP